MTGCESGTFRRVLVFPLNWGLGHATRLIPLISELRKSGVETLIGGSPAHIALLQNELPDLKVVPIPYSRIKFSARNSQALAVAAQVPRLLWNIYREHRALRKLIRDYKPDAVIADNCYGLWNPKVRSIFITHQLNIRLPRSLSLLQRPINRLNHWFIRQFDECWVPDLPDERGLAGDLSRAGEMATRTSYIGLLSRFGEIPASLVSGKNPSVKKTLVILSGPEPQRTQFEDLIRRQLTDKSPASQVTVIRGLPEETSLPANGWHNHVSTSEMYRLILEADHIISRSGYSTVMDLVMCGKSAVLIPTPGQTEQEYLAGHLSRQGLFLMMEEQYFSLEKACRLALPEINADVYRKISAVLLRRKLEEFINKLHYTLPDIIEHGATDQEKSQQETCDHLVN